MLLLTTLAAPAMFVEPPRLRNLPRTAGPTINTSTGPLACTTDAAGVLACEGVPYAAAPVGDLRWRAPAAHAAWSTPLDATAPGKCCTAAEDCLTLQVYRPANTSAVLPIMLWIHGGAYVTGCGSLYDLSLIHI